jgi:sulfatase maturation enzyme AslB (radical SAM superfamily)
MVPRLPGLRSLNVILTSACNLRCAYCYQSRAHPGRISWRTLRPALDLILGSEQVPLKVLFMGGEPLLAFPMLRRAVRYLTARQGPAPRLEFEVATNGTRLTRALRAFLAAHDFDLQISFDGVEEAQRVRGPGTFRVLDRLLDRIRFEEPAYFLRRVSVGVTVTRDTVPHLARSVDYLIAKGVPRILIGPILTDRGAVDSPLLSVLDEQLSRVAAISRLHVARTGEVPVRFLQRFRAAGRRRGPSAWLCGATHGRALTIDIDGTLSGCALLAGSYSNVPTTRLGRRLFALHLGRPEDDDLGLRLDRYHAAAAATGLFDHGERKHSSLGSCRSCPARADCRPCPVGIALQPANEDPDRVPDFFCAFMQRSSRVRRRFPAMPEPVDFVTGRAPVPTLVREMLSLAGRLASLPRSITA